MQISKNLYRGIAGISAGVQLGGYTYDISLHRMMIKKGHDVAMEPLSESLKDNTFSFTYVRIPLMIGLQTYGRQLSLQTGIGLYVGGSDYSYRQRGDDKFSDHHLHTQNFGAQWMMMAGIGPVTLTFSQFLLPLYQLTDGTKAYPASLTVGFDINYWMRRHFRPKLK